MDPQRRRLTVAAPGEDLHLLQQAGAGGSSTPARDALIERLGFEEVFRNAGAEQRIIAVVTETDAERNRKRPFAVKDEVTVVAPDGSEEQTKQWLQASVGWSCNKGLKPGSCNQDCMSILVAEQDFAIYGVYDGHGPYGHDVSEFVCSQLPKRFLEARREDDFDPNKAMERSFADVQHMVEHHNWVQADCAQMSGTTVTLAFHDMKANKLWVGHVGDSRCVLGSADGKKVDPLTEDHKPDLPRERHRIENANPPGRVIFDGYFNHRVFAKDAMVPGLNMSRAMGDLVGHRRAGLSAEPDIVEVDLTTSELGGGPGDRVLLLCTDGVWEFVSNEQALEKALAAASKTAGEQAPTAGIRDVAKLGYDLWLKDSDNEISDDITGILIRLPKVEAEPAAATTGP